MITLGNTEITKAYLGSTEINKMYLGEELVFDGGSTTPILPYDAKVEYLQNSGTQYINTGLYGDIDLDYEITVKITGTAQYHNILGDRYSSSSRRYSLMYDRTSKQYSAYMNAGNRNEVDAPASYRTTNYLTFKKSGLKVYVNNNLIGQFSSQTFTTPNTVILFGCRNNGSLSNSMTGIISSCTFSRNETLIRDFIPVRVGQVGYMYDKVTGELFGNAGSGDFTYGNDIN